MSTQEDNGKTTGNESPSSEEYMIPETEAVSEQPESPAQIEKELSEEDSWKKKFEEINDKYLRLYSEFDNFRKRTAKERIELSKTAGADIFTAILPVVDDFERAHKAMENTEDVETVKEGMNLIYQKLWNLLQQKGLEKVEAKGKEFDADIFEAITSIPAEDQQMKGKVVDVLEGGYALHGKVIRFAKVVVGS
ncbi:MAG: nucleotide exchange factor GrpE [Bacteroidia bacterium]